MNIGAKYYLAIFLLNGKIVHKTFINVYFSDEKEAIASAKKYAAEIGLNYDTIDVTHTGDEEF